MLEQIVKHRAETAKTLAKINTEIEAMDENIKKHGHFSTNGQEIRLAVDMLRRFMKQRINTRTTMYQLNREIAEAQAQLDGAEWPWPRLVDDNANEDA